MIIIILSLRKYNVIPQFRTNQHSCGDPNNHCEIVLQYMCGDLTRDGKVSLSLCLSLSPSVSVSIFPSLCISSTISLSLSLFVVRVVISILEHVFNSFVISSGKNKGAVSRHFNSGTTTRTIPERRDQCENWNCDTDLRYGMHENYAYYRNCKNRDRNEGLFTADQVP